MTGEYVHKKRLNMLENNITSTARMKKDKLQLLRSQQREIMASKMKAEKLRSMLVKLKDGERNSKLRNDNLLQDFSKVADMGANLDNKADRLKNVKKQYEEYITTVYPDWKENIELSRMASSGKYTKQNRATPKNPTKVKLEFDAFEDSPMSDYQPNNFQSTANYAESSRLQNLEPSDLDEQHRLPEKFVNRRKRDTRSAFYPSAERPWQRTTNDIKQEWNELRSELAAPRYTSGYATNDPRDGLFEPESYTHYHDQSLRVSPRRSSQRRSSPRSRESRLRGGVPQSTRPDILNIPRADPTDDMSEFTIIPQALALSPDGKLVLLPMAFSPGLQVSNTIHAGSGIERANGMRGSATSNTISNERHNDMKSNTHATGVGRGSGMKVIGTPDTIGIGETNSIQATSGFNANCSRNNGIQTSNADAYDSISKRPMGMPNDKVTAIPATSSSNTITDKARDDHMGTKMNGFQGIENNTHDSYMPEISRGSSLVTDNNTPMHALTEDGRKHQLVDSDSVLVSSNRKNYLEKSSDSNLSLDRDAGTRRSDHNRVKSNEMDPMDESSGVLQSHAVKAHPIDGNGITEVGSNARAVLTDSNKSLDARSCSLSYLEDDGSQEESSTRFKQTDFKSASEARVNSGSNLINASDGAIDGYRKQNFENNDLDNDMSNSRSALNFENDRLIEENSFLWKECNVEDEPSLVKEKPDIQVVAESKVNAIEESRLSSLEIEDGLSDTRQDGGAQQKSVPTEEYRKIEADESQYRAENRNGNANDCIQNNSPSHKTQKSQEIPPDRSVPRMEKTSSDRSNVDREPSSTVIADCDDKDAFHGESTKEDCLSPSLLPERTPSENTHTSQSPAMKGEKYSCMGINDLSYLLEEIENRMGIESKTEFYSARDHKTSSGIIKDIKKAVVTSDTLEGFETRDLCSVAAIEISGLIRESGNSCFLKENANSKFLKTNQSVRAALIPGFNDLWDYVFNHMELLIGSNVLSSSIVAEKFSSLLSVDNKNMQALMKKVLGNLLASSDQGSDASEISDGSVDQKLESPVSRTQLHCDEIEGESPLYQQELLEKGAVDGQAKGSGFVLTTDERAEKQKKSKDFDELSLDLGSVSDEDDSSSTFDSTQFTARRETDDNLKTEEGSLAEDSREEHESNIDSKSSEESSESLQEIPTEISNEKSLPSQLPTEEDTESPDETDDSDNELEDMLSSSLMRSGNRSTVQCQKSIEKHEDKSEKEEKSSKKKSSFFNSLGGKTPNDDDTSAANKSSLSSPKKDVLSPNNSKSISNKFRKPGFWENSDSESEADLKVSGGNVLSEDNDNDDDFDFDFYN